MFFDQAKDQCAALTAAIESGDVDDIKINLHTMKGTSGSLKIMEIYELVEPLYAQVQTGDAVALAKESLPKIQVILAEVRAAYTA
ncbi:MAG: HPt (histidine-containing phosphotransfer) domain-containing protein [Candidatus Omnitrophota bacterium]|jgi:HPt (histidine-containing phosphotransfer) domain-containing protein